MAKWSLWGTALLIVNANNRVDPGFMLFPPDSIVSHEMENWKSSC